MKKTLLLISFLMITFSAAWAVTGLNPYAHNLKAEQTNDNRTLRISYCLNAEAKSVTIEILSEDGRTVLLSQSGPTQETTYSTSNSSYTSPNTVDISIANLIGYIGKSLPWRITVVGDSPEVPTKVSQTYNFYCPQGVAVDNNPTSPNFGKIFVTETLHGASIVESKNYYSKMPYGKTEAGTIVAGVYVLSPDFRKITANSTPLTGGKDFSQVIKPFSGFDGGHQPYRICISEDSRIFVSSGDKRSDKVIVWEIDKNNLNSWTPLIQGSTWNDEWQVTRNSSFYAGLNCSMDVTGSGSNLKLLLFSTNKTSAKGMVSNGFRLDEYSIGTSTGVFTGTPREISALSGKYAVAYDNVNVIYDGKGGYWFGASRGENISKQLNLLHVNADENTTNNSYYKDTLYGGAGLKIHHSSLGEDWLIKGVKMVNNNGRFRIWKLKYSGQTPSRSTKYNVISGGMKRNHNAFAIDYAENLFVVGNNGEKCYAFALPYCGTKTTPAAQEITLQKPDNLKTYNINLAISNDSEGMGTVDGGGAHLEMDSITVSALPTDANRYEFEKWTENEVTVSTNANYTFQVTKERNLVAHFKIKKFKVEYFNLFQNQQDITDYHKTYNDPETEQIDYQRNTRLWRLFQVEYNAIYTPHDDRGDVAAYNPDNKKYYRELFKVHSFLSEESRTDNNETNQAIRNNTQQFLDENTTSSFYWLGRYLEHVVKREIVQPSNFNLWADFLQSFINRTQHHYNKNMHKTGEANGTDKIEQTDYLITDFSAPGRPTNWRKWWQQIELGLDTSITYDTQLPGTWHMRTPPTGSIKEREYDGTELTGTLTPGNWYKWNNHAANPGKVLGWYYGEKDPTTWITDPSQVEIVHNVTQDGNLVAIWVDNYIAQNKDNYDVVKLLKTNTGVDHSVRVFHPLQGGMYNTICLPFAVRALPDALEGATVLKLHNSEIVKEQAVSSIDEPVDESEGEGEGEGETFEGEQLLNIYFTEVTFEGDDIMEAGVPYLIMPTVDIPGEITFETTSEDMYEMQKDGLGRIVTDANNNIAFQGVINPYKLQDNAHILILVADNRLAVPTIHIDDSDEENIVISNNDILGLRGYFILQGEAAAQSLAYQSTMYLPSKTPTELTESVETTPANTAAKVLHNGRIYILRGDEVYDLMGNRVR